MDQYLLRSGTHKIRHGKANPANSMLSKMADSRPASPVARKEESPTDLQQGADLVGPQNIDYKTLAIEVAKYLAPDIRETLSKTLSLSLQQLHDAIAQHDTRLDELEQRLAHVEEDAAKANQRAQELYRHNVVLMDRIEDLENRSRRNNLRLVGLPETIRPQALKDICERELPSALNLEGVHKVERAHRIGPPPAPQTLTGEVHPSLSPRPRQVIMRFLDFCDKETILRAYRLRKEPLILRGRSILLFADYSASVAKKRRDFGKVCSALFKKRIKFQLQYPANLRVSHSDGSITTFHDPKTAEEFLSSMGNNLANVEVREDRLASSSQQKSSQSGDGNTKTLSNYNTSHPWETAPRSRRSPKPGVFQNTDQ